MLTEVFVLLMAAPGETEAVVCPVYSLFQPYLVFQIDSKSERQIFYCPIKSGFNLKLATVTSASAVLCVKCLLSKVFQPITASSLTSRTPLVPAPNVRAGWRSALKKSAAFHLRQRWREAFTNVQTVSTVWGGGGWYQAGFKPTTSEFYSEDEVTIV